MNILDKLARGIVTSQAEETIEIARNLATVLPEEAVLALEGDLGAGKTTFVKGLAERWRIQEPITSPTFNIYNLYQGDRQLAHMDAYRLEKSPEIWEELMLEELIAPPFCLAIEWPSKLAFIPWTITHTLRFDARGDERKITLIS
ncbi:tRNA (adenosine(37)-N6)-threonylcarbamoyltransferase complex ATPase subunit type 1 TsaE [Pelagicoccus sp. SDUM812003]|uniref:tRNA (adenosine(37)-N6)-threonylcarbamoyltransferase complex ATPase subunit type 1 TsaE n=1 Tax=Pelagicoccus sp. SDUM812003 TaxID=3041267 RepID=UPI00280E2875|nr:tRNA (adenosine(37)-N6)-threonylcarbamoyltransferase complex ATPase subunit type 1 TsaE [Pelagicoccus sp. SDUM812003]MDQ8203696.1 tRNA (adenosine(37)-N6)-threonylcarbamoyltransferase complex ATPase subunit type 1 TsaE [Pelagicoccus sp. SDUM812003]